MRRAVFGKLFAWETRKYQLLKLCPKNVLYGKFDKEEKLFFTGIYHSRNIVANGHCYILLLPFNNVIKRERVIFFISE